MGVLLAGGAARRFGGRPKGLATIDGERMADRVLSALGAASDSQVVVSNDPRASRWFTGMPVVSDEVAGLGPLAGLETALRAGRGAAVLVVAWDMPFVTGALLLTLRAVGERNSTCVAPTHGEPPIVEPLCGYYSPDALGLCSSLLARGERRALALFASFPTALSLDAGELYGKTDAARLLSSVDDLTQLSHLGGTLPQEK